jgi:hypothetical protein
VSFLITKEKVLIKQIRRIKNFDNINVDYLKNIELIRIP